MQTDSDILLFELKRRWCSSWCSPPHLSMFNLMSNFCTWASKLQQPLRKVTVLVVGLDKAGKTSCMRGMLRAPLGETGATHACVRHELRLENFLITLLDTGGAPDGRVSWKDHCGEAHGLVFVVDSSDRARMKEVKELLTEVLRQPRVAGKPLLVLANKQDKVNAMLGSELIEVLNLEKLVNQSRSLCHVEPCSAVMDPWRWSDRKTLRGLRWLLRAVSLDYPDICARVVRDGRRPLEPEERERKGRGEKSRRKNDDKRIRGSRPDIQQAQRHLEKDPKSRDTLQPVRDILTKENSFKKLKKRKVKVKIKRRSVKNGGENPTEENEQEEEEAEGQEAEQDHSGQKEKASNALLPRKRGKLKRKAKVKEETLDHAESPEHDDSKLTKGKGVKKKKKKVVKGKRKNKINTEGIPAAYTQPADLSATFDLYRKAILALKARQDQNPVSEQ